MVIRGASIIVGKNISPTGIKTLLIHGQNRIWIDTRLMKKNNGQTFLQKGGGFIIIGKGTPNISDLLSARPEGIFIVGRGFSFNDLSGFIKRNSNIILDSTWKEKDINLLLTKGKGNVFIKGANFTKDQLLTFIKGEAHVILDYSLTIQDIQQFLSISAKNVYIKSHGFELSDLENFLKLGGHIIIKCEGITVAEGRHLVDKGKRKVWIDTCDFFEN